jgi:hypothetical protein
MLALVVMCQGRMIYKDVTMAQGVPHAPQACLHDVTETGMSGKAWVED